MKYFPFFQDYYKSGAKKNIYSLSKKEANKHSEQKAFEVGEFRMCKRPD
jgi:hypothetical protein